MATRSPKMPVIKWSEKCCVDTPLIHHLQATKVPYFTDVPQIEIRMENWSSSPEKKNLNLIDFQLSFKKKISYSYPRVIWSCISPDPCYRKYLFGFFNE